jgi:hypothetical protein
LQHPTLVWSIHFHCMAPCFYSGPPRSRYSIETIRVRCSGAKKGQRQSLTWLTDVAGESVRATASVTYPDVYKTDVALTSYNSAALYRKTQRMREDETECQEPLDTYGER